MAASLYLLKVKKNNFSTAPLKNSDFQNLKFALSSRYQAFEVLERSLIFMYVLSFTIGK